MLVDIVHRYSAHRAACKQCSVALGIAILLVGALGKVAPANLLWAAAPLLLLGLAEAGYAGQERRCLELLKGKKGNEEVVALLPEAANASILRTAVAAMSVSIWPYYLGLFAIVAVGSGALTSPEKGATMQATAQIAARPVAQGAHAAGCGSGGCGTAKGCGSGSSCGASAGKACSCSGGATTAAANMPAPQYLPATNGPMPLPALPVRQPVGQPLTVRPPLNPAMQQSGQPAFQPNVQRASPHPGVAFPPPAAPVPSPLAPTGGASDPASRNP